MEKVNIHRVKELLESISNENLEALSTKDILSLGQTLEKYYNQIKNSEVLLRINDLQEKIPSDRLPLFKIESKGVRKVTKKSSIIEQNNILKKLIEADKASIEKYEKCRKILDKIKTSTIDDSLKIISELSNQQKKEVSLVGNVTKISKGNSEKVLMLSQTKKSNIEWIELYHNSRRIVSIFDVKETKK